jgi:ADP-ribosylglycohydrolase
MTYGACFGDVAGAPSEFTGRPGWSACSQPPAYEHDLTDSAYKYTDDSVLTTVTGRVLATAPYKMSDDDLVSTLAVEYARAVRNWQDSGWGSRFYAWAFTRELEPYGSYGNGSAMRVSPVGWLYDSEDTVLEMARLTALPTHGHPDGVRGAQAIALAVFLARSKYSKRDIHDELDSIMNHDGVKSMIGPDKSKSLVPDGSHYDLDRSVASIIDSDYQFDETCQGSVPEALCAFLDPSSIDYQTTLVNTIRLGGDSDTQCAMTGAIAEAMWGMPPAYARDEQDRLEAAGLDANMKAFTDNCAAYGSIVRGYYEA